MFLIDLHDANEGETNAREWAIETEQKDRILILTISTTDGSPLDQEQLRSLMVSLFQNRINFYFKLLYCTVYLYVNIPFIFTLRSIRGISKLKYFMSGTYNSTSYDL